MRLSGDRKERERYEKCRESRLNEISTLSYAEEKGAKKMAKEIDKDIMELEKEDRKEQKEFAKQLKKQMENENY